MTALQTGPIVIGGTMYFTTDTISYAIDAGDAAPKNGRACDTARRRVGWRSIAARRT